MTGAHDGGAHGAAGQQVDEGSACSVEPRISPPVLSKYPLDGDPLVGPGQGVMGVGQL